RKKLRSTAQLLAHLAIGHVDEGLQGGGSVKSDNQLRNFLRIMAESHRFGPVIWLARRSH
ncbi:MAG: hypothetical protein M3Q94_01385, partial [Pseudomonadota bacterium]|nr:hypothetical protein [Pseudomonadota bacterium]